MTIVVIILVCFFVLLLCGIPIAVSVGLATAVALLGGGFSLTVLPQKIFVAVNSFTLLAIPFFMLAGSIMEHSGITERLVKFADAIVGWMKCGMCYVTAVAGMLMGGISGSAAADTAALSAILIPAMEDMGYPKKFTAPLIAASGTIGVIIPPSLCFIILGSVTNISVSKLFMAGIIPGIIVGLGLMLASRIVCGRFGWGMRPVSKFSLPYLWDSFRKALIPIFAPVIIIGGILAGVCTPTEASVIAVIYTFIIGVFVYKKISLRDLVNIVASAARGTAVVMFVVGTSMVFSWILTVYNVPTILGSAITSISSHPLFVLGIITVIFFIGGMFIDGTPLILMLVPVLFPISQAVGIDPLAFGVIICINNAIGGVSPPVGTALFIACSFGKVKIEEAAPYTIPVLIAMLCAVVLVAVFPVLATFIPGFI